MNIYQPTKVALLFCLAPDFLPEVEYPKKPFGMFFIISPCKCMSLSLPPPFFSLACCGL